jgi:hypothetical protein
MIPPEVSICETSAPLACGAAAAAGVVDASTPRTTVHASPATAVMSRISLSMRTRKFPVLGNGYPTGAGLTVIVV